MDEVGVFADLAAVAGHVERETPERARPLQALTAWSDGWAAYWLDDDARILWQAVLAEGAADGSGGPWRLLSGYAAMVLPEVLADVAEVLDALAEPATGYAGTAERDAIEERHLAVLDDVYDIELAALSRGARRARYVAAYDVDQAIQRQINLAKAEVSRLAGLRARHILNRYGRERGAGKKAAQALRVSPPTIATLITADTARRGDLRAAAKAARQSALDAAADEQG